MDNINNLIEEINKLCDGIKEYSNKDLIGEDKLGASLSFKEFEPIILQVISLTDKVRGLDLQIIIEGQLISLLTILININDCLGEIVNFSISDGNSFNKRQSIINDLNNYYTDLINALNPILTVNILMREEIVGTALNLSKELKAEFDKTIGDFDVFKNKMEVALSLAKAEALIEKAARNSNKFKREADEFETQAKRWFYGMIGIILLIVGCAVVATWLSFTPWLKTTDTYQIIQLTITKGLIFAALFYGLNLCNKNYKAQRHNALVNRHRHVALQTFESFISASGKDEQTKNAIILETTRTIFTGQQTGYLNTENETEFPTKIIEIIKGGSIKGD